MRGIAILLAFTFAGNLCSYLLKLPLSGNVIGLILLAISLFAGWIRLEWVEESGQFLLKHMMIFFAPTIVGTMLFFDRFANEGWAILCGLTLGFVCVLLATGSVTAALSRAKEGKDQDAGIAG